MKHYEGDLGVFDYNEELWEITDGALRYVGSIIEGKIVGEIPAGVVNCHDMFNGCISLKQAPQIPESVRYCGCMFIGCISLKEVPVIPAGVEDCHCMFTGCTSLKEAPQISKGVTDCSCMFIGCTSLVKAPDIPVGVVNCHDMFNHCISLKKAPSGLKTLNSFCATDKLNKSEEKCMQHPVWNILNKEKYAGEFIPHAEYMHDFIAGLVRMSGNCTSSKTGDTVPVMYEFFDMWNAYSTETFRILSKLVIEENELVDNKCVKNKNELHETL